MTTQELINTLRQGAPVTARQVKAIVSQLERIPAMERTLAAKDRDFTQLSIAYSAAIDARIKSTGEIILTNDEANAVEEALADAERLKEAVRAMLRAKAQGVSAYTAALKAVEELL